MASLRRLRDNPLVARMERDAVLNRSYASDMSAWLRSDELDAVSRSIFGVAQADIGPEDTDNEAADNAFYETYSLLGEPDWDQVRGFEALGWDVTDEHGRPLLVLGQLSYQLLAAIRGEYGARLPGEASMPADTWGAQIDLERVAFERRRRR